MGEPIPTIKVKDKETGETIIINTLDFDEEKHAHLDAGEKKDKSHLSEKQRAEDEKADIERHARGLEETTKSKADDKAAKIADRK